MRLSSILTGIFSFLIVSANGIAHGDTLRIGGTGAALGGMTLLGAAFEKQNPGAMIEVLPSLGSSGGIKALIAGVIDLSVASRVLKRDEKVQGVEARLYAITPLAVATSSGTDADAVTTEQLAQMYSGEMTYWPSGQPVRLVLRPMSETDTQILSGLSDGMSQAIKAAHQRPGLLKAINDQDNADMLEQLDGSIGAIAMGQIMTENRRVKVLPLNGILPEVGGDSSQDLRLRKSLYIVKTQRQSNMASQFFDFVFSEKAQSILAATNHAPAR
ncbi:PstS family phosphate ABC transporter substrate-binding protein [Pararhizobium sp. IMCC21322]|uniref:PstS family phosphate ABC transporter substrate-binding protein n=1 Tax=Pararhizobium sp. IMCC21322 TaxID=3067903 RepID=UPI002741BDCF|nr:substrate-binding domain-containing protein [Pararhizobium sp. IMCC21322]